MGDYNLDTAFLREFVLQIGENFRYIFLSKQYNIKKQKEVCLCLLPFRILMKLFCFSYKTIYFNIMDIFSIWFILLTFCPSLNPQNNNFYPLIFLTKYQKLNSLFKTIEYFNCGICKSHITIDFSYISFSSFKTSSHERSTLPVGTIAFRSCTDSELYFVPFDSFVFIDKQ